MLLSGVPLSDYSDLSRFVTIATHIVYIYEVVSVPWPWVVIITLYYTMLSYRGGPPGSPPPELILEKLCHNCLNISNGFTHK